MEFRNIFCTVQNLLRNSVTFCVPYKICYIFSRTRTKNVTVFQSARLGAQRRCYPESKFDIPPPCSHRLIVYDAQSTGSNSRRQHSMYVNQSIDASAERVSLGGRAPVEDSIYPHLVQPAMLARHSAPDPADKSVPNVSDQLPSYPI